MYLKYFSIVHAGSEDIVVNLGFCKDNGQSVTSFDVWVSSEDVIDFGMPFESYQLYDVLLEVSLTFNKGRTISQVKTDIEYIIDAKLNEYIDTEDFEEDFSFFEYFFIGLFLDEVLKPLSLLSPDVSDYSLLP